MRLIDAIFDLERTINGADSATRFALRREWTAPRVTDLERWMRRERERLSRHASVAQAMDYMLKRWDRFARFLEDGRICLTNNAAERALRGVALGRKAWLFCGSDRGGDRAALMYTLITTAKLNDLDPQAWLGDVLARIANLPLSRLPELLPWEWARRRDATAIAAGKAGIAWERLFDAPEEKSLRTLRYELDLTTSTIEKLEARIQELREFPTLGFTTFLDTAQISALERKLDELRRARDQTQARIAFLEGLPDTGAPAPTSAPALDDTAPVQDRAKNLERIARELEGTLFSITHEGSARIIAEHERRVAEIEALRTRDSSNAQEVDQLIAQSAAVRDAQLSQLRAKEVEAAEKVRAANARVVGSLEAERGALTQTERERFVAQALSRLSAEATAQQRREVEQLAGALFDEQQALQARQRLLDEGRSVIDRTGRRPSSTRPRSRSSTSCWQRARSIRRPTHVRWKMRTTGRSARARRGPTAPPGS